MVQQALLRAYAAWPALKNPERPVLLAWLRRILARTLAEVVKHYDRNKRAVCIGSARTGRFAFGVLTPAKASSRSD